MARHAPTSALALLCLGACGASPSPSADAAGDGGLDAPPATALPAVSVGDLTLQTYSDGGFTLTAGGRAVLSARGAAAFARRYHESPRMAFGVWSFPREDEVTLRPSGEVTARASEGAIELNARAGEASSRLTFRRASPGEVELRVTVTAGAPVSSVGLRLECTARSRFVGFGEQYNAIDHRGRAFPLWVSEGGIGRPEVRRNAFSGDHATTYFPVPFFLDPAAGVGLALDTDARVDVDLCAADPSAYTMEAAFPGEAVFHLYTGPTVGDVMREWTTLQGRSAAAPRWAVEGAWLAVQGGPERVRAAVASARAANVPLAAIWSQDWLGRREFGMGNVGVRYRWSADENLYPDLPGLIRELRDGGVRFLGYMNPFIVPEQDLWETALREDYIVRRADGAPATFVISVLTGGVWDVTNPSAVEWYRGYARAALAMGQAGWMHDFGEWLPLDGVLHDGSDPRLAHNRYPTLWQRAARSEMEAQRPDGDWILLTRSGWLRTAAVSQVVWAGDQEATWDGDDGLATVIPAMVSLGVAGVGFVTHDIAGFSGGPSTKELYQRWTELAAFTPIFRTHEGLQRDLNWNWDRDAETAAHFSRFARVHRALAPTFVSLGERHRATGMPIVRALPLEFPDDDAGYRVMDEFMIGSELLVAPVVTMGASSRAVHLPPGRWYDLWDATRSWEGPADITVDAPIGRPPAFSRAPREDLAAIR